MEAASPKYLLQDSSLEIPGHKNFPKKKHPSQSHEERTNLNTKRTNLSKIMCCINGNHFFLFTMEGLR
jgi:hypothetical protein